MSGSWLTVLAGGVGGGVLTNGWGEWRQLRSNRREDGRRFHAERLVTASEILKLANEAQRIQTREYAQAALPVAEAAAHVDLELEYRRVVEALDGAGARFRLLFPEAQRITLQRLVESIDQLAVAISRHEGFRSALETHRTAVDEFSTSCRSLLAGLNER